MRLSRYARWAALALAGPLVAGVLAALPAQSATTPPWRVWHVYPATSSVNAVAATGPRDAWAFGALPGAQSYVARFNGARWTRVAFPVNVTGASALSAGNIWVDGWWAGQTPKGASPIAVEHLADGAWHTVRVPSLKLPKGDAVGGAAGVVADGPDNVWVISGLSNSTGEAAGIIVLHWNGKAFTQVNVPYSALWGPYYLTEDGTGGIWLAANETVKTKFLHYLFRYDDGRWTRIPTPSKPENQTWLAAVAWIPGTRSAWATGLQSLTTGVSGQQGVILKYGP